MIAYEKELLIVEYSSLEQASLDKLFLEARTYNGWKDRVLSKADFEKIYNLTKMGPTATNASPARFVFVSTEDGFKRLKPHLSKGNLDKTMAAGACVIVGYDLDFGEKIPELFPHFPGAAAWFTDPKVQYETAFRNSSLQGGYLIMAARSLGYDCGPMSGFDHDGVDAEFFAGTNVKSNFLINIGAGDPASIKGRLPRLSFEDACSIA